MSPTSAWSPLRCSISRRSILECRRRDHDHRQPQSARVQRIQTVCGAGTLHGESHPGGVCKSSSGGDFESGRRNARDRRRRYCPTWTRSRAQFHFDRRIKVVADAGNGTAGPVIHRIFERSIVDATELFFEMDGAFPEPSSRPHGSRQLSRLVEKVRETEADLGIAFDGDSDRIGAVDENGRRHLRRHAAADLRPRDPAAQARRDVHRRSEMLAGDVRRDRRDWAAMPSCTRPAIR